MKYLLGDKIKVILGVHDGKVGFIDNIIYYNTDRKPEYNVVFTDEDFTKVIYEEAQLDGDYIESFDPVSPKGG